MPLRHRQNKGHLIHFLLPADLRHSSCVRTRHCCWGRAELGCKGLRAAPRPFSTQGTGEVGAHSPAHAAWPQHMAPDCRDHQEAVWALPPPSYSSGQPDWSILVHSMPPPSVEEESWKRICCSMGSRMEMCSWAGASCSPRVPSAWELPVIPGFKDEGLVKPQGVFRLLLERVNGFLVSGEHK